MSSEFYCSIFLTMVATSFTMPPQQKALLFKSAFCYALIMIKKILLAIGILVAVLIGLSFVNFGKYKLTIAYSTGNSGHICFLPVLTKGQTIEVGHLGGRSAMEYHYLPVHPTYADAVCKLMGIE